MRTVKSATRNKYVQETNGRVDKILVRRIRRTEYLWEVLLHGQLAAV